MSFRLLHLKVFDDCTSHLLKNIKPGTTYKFYESSESTDEYLPNDFYGNGNININVSAIVGKNGSGKSALIELFIGCLNQLSMFLRFETKDLNSEASLQVVSEGKGSGILHCEISYEIDSDKYQLEVNNTDIHLYKNEKNVKDFKILEKFFYSIIINYSLYAFNSNEMGKWVEGLFHKNDSYQIPVVINPKREERSSMGGGIIDINNENYLIQQRLLFNVLDKENPIEISENLIPHFLKLVLEPEKEYSIFNRSSNSFKDPNNIIIYRGSTKYIVGNTLQRFKESFEIDEINIEGLQKNLDIYILYKIISICEKYKSFEIYREKISNSDAYKINIKDFVIKFSEYETHITLKLRQTINFIKYYETIWKKYVSNTSFINIKEIATDIESLSQEENISRIDLLPPPIYSTTLLSKDKVDILKNISSGEKQLIHSTSSIIYHLKNIDSVKADDKIYKYQYVNLVLDEIELYFHPEFQRQYIHRLLKNIKDANLNSIKGLNIILISHSPFILSDIPKQNILFLESKNGFSFPKKYDSDNTFAENTHEILSNGFFLRDTKGEFARNKVTDYLEYYRSTINTNDIDINSYNRDRKEYKKLIDLIGEDYLNTILTNYLKRLDKKVLGNNDLLELKKRELYKLQIEINELKNEKN